MCGAILPNLLLHDIIPCGAILPNLLLHDIIPCGAILPNFISQVDEVPNIVISWS